MDKDIKEWIWWLSFLSIIIIAIDLYLLISKPFVDTTPIKHIQKYEEKKEDFKKAIFTGYNLEENQTDGTPCIGAGNHNLCLEQSKKTRRICASRFLPLHSIIEIKGIGNCEILDRISNKYSDRIDILFETKQEAKNWGKKEVEYRVIQ